jgi:pimeloyl-ACP methyl ester carboxylesterase
VAIPEAGHMPQIEQPKLFVEALDHFAGVEFHKKAA